MCLEVVLYPCLTFKGKYCHKTRPKKPEHSGKNLSSVAGGPALSLISTIRMLASTISFFLLHSVLILTHSVSSLSK